MPAALFGSHGREHQIHLRGGRRRLHQRQDFRPGNPHPTRDHQHSGEAAVGIVDGRGSSGELMHPMQKMFRAVDPGGTTGADHQTDGIGSDPAFGQIIPLAQPDLGRSLDPIRIAVHRQHPAELIGDHHDQPDPGGVLQ